RKVRGEPLDDATLEGDSSIALPDQLGGDAGARQFVGIGVVDDQIAIARQGCGRSPTGVSDRARQLDRTVLERILETRVDDDWRVAAVEPLFEIFLGDAEDRHARVLWLRAAGSVKFDRVGYRAAARLNGSRRGVVTAGSRWACAGIGAVCRGGVFSIAQPDERLPQCTQR